MQGNKPLIHKKIEVVSNETSETVSLEAGVPVLEYR